MSEETNVSTDLATLLGQGIELANRGDADGALAALNRVLHQEPNCAKALCGRGTALRLKGQIDEAIANYNAAIRLDPNYAHAYFNRGLARHQRMESAQAFADFDHAIELHPEAAFFSTTRLRARICDSRRVEVWVGWSLLAPEARKRPSCLTAGLQNCHSFVGT